MEEDIDNLCDMRDCTREAVGIMMAHGMPVAKTCQECEDLIMERTRDGTHRINLDVHFHRHAVVDLVDATEVNALELGAQYVDPEVVN